MFPGGILTTQVYFRVFKTEKDIMVAVCDADIIGKNFSDGKRKLEINEHFYKGTLGTLDDGIQAMNDATIVNVIGEKIVTKMIQDGIINEHSVIRICGIPHVQLICV